MPEILDEAGLDARLGDPAWPGPGTLAFGVAGAAWTRALGPRLAHRGPVWVGWSRREALLRSWRPAAQERYHSVAGRDAPSVRDWLEPAYCSWKPGPDGLHHRVLDERRREAALALCGLGALAGRSVSLLSNGEAARACLAFALGSDPSLLILDNLAEGLDALGKATLLQAAQSLARGGKAVLVLAGRVGVLPLPGPRPVAVPAPARAAVRPSSGAGEAVFSSSGLDLWAGERLLLKGLDWTLRRGEAWRLGGPNGAGKSTLLAYLSGEHPQAWARSWALLGRDRFAWTPLESLRRQVAWVSPELAAAADTGVGDLLKRALDGPAPLLLLDETLRGLDEAQLARERDALDRALAGRRADKAVVFVSHDPSELPDWVDRTLTLNGDGSWTMG